MALPSPLPDDPRKWDGWRHHASENFYERLCLSHAENPGPERIEENSRQLLVWWQKKLPLKNQPSNPMSQLLRGGLMEAAHNIAEARAELLQPERRAEIDSALNERRRRDALAEFQKFLDFALVNKVLTKDAEDNLFKLGRALGLHGADVTASIRQGVVGAGAVREAGAPPAPAAPPAAAVVSSPAGTNGSGRATRRVTHRVTARAKPLAEEEHRRFPAFLDGLGNEMLLVTSGRFLMGSHSTDAPVNEQPAAQTTLRRFYLSRFPITNAQYERFDPEHATWRGPQTGDDHPVVYVSHFDAIRFCAWLSALEDKKYRLPTEAEWEYAARGTDGRIYPWAATLKASLAKVTLLGGGNGRVQPRGESGRQGKVAPNLDDGGTGPSAVGDHPLGASPFGIEDLAGNVWEWCQDFYDAYKGAERVDPRGPLDGTERVCRGGSWKSPFVGMKTTTRGHYPPQHASNDVGFRIVCECD